MSETVYSVILRDEDYVRIDELADWLSFSYVKRFNGVGTWELEVSNLSVSAPLITKTSGIIVTRDGATIFSGSVATEYTRTATTLRVAGYDDNVLLNVPALPDVDGPPYTTEYDVRTAPQASSVLIQAVQFNIGPNARADRIVPQLVLAANPILGGSVTYRGRFQNLITYLRDLASTPAAGGLGFDLMQTDGDDTLTFRVFEPPDKRADAVFSIESLTAQDYQDAYTHPPYNKVFVLLGDGLGSNRSVIEDEDATVIAEVGRRIETVIDARDVTDTGEGEQRAAEALAGAVSSRRVTVSPFQINTLVFGTDYDLGDLVTFVIDGETFDDIVTEVRVEFDLVRGPIVTPSIGFGDDPDDDAHVVRQIAAVDARLTNIERNYNVPDDSITNAMLTAASVKPANLDAINSPTDGLIPVYDGGTLRFEWIAADTLIDDLHLTTLTVTGTSVLAATTATTVTASSTVQGTRLISTISTGTAPLTVASTTKVDNLNADLLDGVDSAAFALLAGATFTGVVTLAPTVATEAPLVIKGSGTSGQVTLGASNVSTPDLIVKNNAGTQTARMLNSGLLIVGTATAAVSTAGAGDVQCNDLWLVNGANFRRILINSTALQISNDGNSGTHLTLDGSGILTVHGLTADTNGADVTGNSIFRDPVEIEGTLTISGTNNIDVNGGTAGQIRVGTLIVNRASLSGSYKLDVDGDFRFSSNGLINGGVEIDGTIDHDGSAIGLYGVSPVARQTVSGSRASGAALAALLAALDNTGIIIDSTSA